MTEGPVTARQKGDGDLRPGSQEAGNPADVLRVAGAEATERHRAEREQNEAFSL